MALVPDALLWVGGSGPWPGTCPAAPPPGLWDKDTDKSDQEEDWEPQTSLVRQAVDRQVRPGKKLGTTH